MLIFGDRIFSDALIIMERKKKPALEMGRRLLQSQTLSSFRRHLKAIISLSCPLAPIPNATWFSSDFWDFEAI